MNLESCNIIVGVTGGIAAYKIPELVRMLVKAQASVQCVMTQAAHQFITPLTLETLSHKPVLTSVFDRIQTDSPVAHVSLAHKADLIIVAPATADFIARIAHGFADDMLSLLIMSSTCPVLIVPAMEPNMWDFAMTQKNIESLRACKRFYFLGPACGELASLHQGVGRMSEVSEIMTRIYGLMQPQDYQGKQVLISAGPTREMIDSVRYLSNLSSGKMGLALAYQAYLRGAHVTLVHGPIMASLAGSIDTCDKARMCVTEAHSTTQMQQALEAHAASADVIIMAAAVCDYAPIKPHRGKLKKDKLGSQFELTLTETVDILKSLRQQSLHACMVGFAAETDNVIAHAQKKLKDKNLDFIVVNDVSIPGIGFESDDNQVTILSRHGLCLESGRMSKQAIAQFILRSILKS